MFFKRKVDRVINVNQAEEKFLAEMEALKQEGMELEKKDKFAMLLAAYLVFIPEVLLLGGLLAFAMWMLFR